MPYTVQQLASLANVTARTLHHYDHIGLLSPSEIGMNGYRYYGESELLRLQQILFFRELGIPLSEIKTMLDNPGFDIATALAEHRGVIELKRSRMDELITTIDHTISRIKNNISMDDKDLYNGFSHEEGEKYAEEAKERWGNTDAYRQSQERVKNMTKDDMARIGSENYAPFKKIV